MHVSGTEAVALQVSMSLILWQAMLLLLAGGVGVSAVSGLDNSGRALIAMSLSLFAGTFVVVTVVCITSVDAMILLKSASFLLVDYL